jgi:TRAP transporter 4TM/12TM fusion protein
MSDENETKYNDGGEASGETPPVSDDAVPNEEDINKFMAKVDKESNTRHYSGVPKIIMRCICVGFSLFTLSINTIFLLPAQVHRTSFVALVVLCAFLLYPARKKDNIRVNHVPWYDLIFALTGLACFLYYAFNFETIVGQRGTYTTIDTVVAIIAIIILFIACYRVTGLPLMIVVGVFIAYFYFGKYIPGQFGHAGRSVSFIATRLFYTTEGIISTPVGVASTFIFVFMLFGAFLEKTGIGQFFIDISNALVGKSTGGPAKMAVIASALGGLVSGSSVANTVASGSFTIPLMKRLGYNKNFAGAVEASASTGGQLLPPILGAAAFIMVEITGIPYTTIALAALIPAILYFACIFAAVHFEAKKLGLRGMPPEDVPKAIPLFLQKGHLLLGIVSIVAFLTMGFTPTRSALFAILVSIAVSMFRKDTRLTPKAFIDALETGARNTVSVGIACAMAGMVVGVVVLTGLGLTFASTMLSLANNIGHPEIRLFIVLFCTMLASLVLGMGVPTTAKYVIMATVTAPILVSEPLLLPVLVAHMFVFYFGTDADITPPVGLAAYAAAAISKGSPLMTSVIAVRLSVASYIIPFIFAFNPAMLLVDTNAFEVIKIVIFGIFGIVSLASGLSGYLLRRLRWYERILASAAGLAMIHPDLISSIIGTAVILGMGFMQWYSSKKRNGEVLKTS